MSAWNATVMAQINDGPEVWAELIIETETHVETTAAGKPDLAWTFVDSNGHYHAYSQTNLSNDAGEGKPYPTLLSRVEHIDCDGHHLAPIMDDPCEGYDVVRYHCRICDEEIKPDMIPGPHSFTVAGLTTWQVTCESPSAPYAEIDRRPVSVRAVTKHSGQEIEYFGVAHRFDQSWPSFVLLGVGPLGKRNLRAFGMPS